MPSNTVRSVCIPCRAINVYDKDWNCKFCGGPTLSPKGAHGGWSPPKKNNDRAWRMIEKGDWLWDKKRVLRAEKKQPLWIRLGADYYFNLKRANPKQR